VAVVSSRRVNDAMIAAAADTIDELAHPTGTGATLLPPVTDLRTASAAVAIAVAQAAVKHGLAAQPLTDPPFEPI
jgi:malic enzyme